ncbi:MAG: preprotein translocase subunit SecA [Gammaproteobacteria bacterium]
MQLLTKTFSKIFGSRNDRIIKRMRKVVAQVNAFEDELAVLTDAQLLDKTTGFKQRLANGETLDQILPEAFAVVREASKRTLRMRHFDVQLIGGMVLHQGKIAEMCTGEGKTLMATLAAYLNALSGKGVHVITVNDYLAKRDAEWMAPIYEMLGLTVSVNVAGLSPEDKRAAYAADITYGTNNEFGFDYLRDNMAFSLEDRVQRDLNFAIVDEVDSILIDEARTPLIISGALEDSSELYIKINKVVPKLTKQENPDAKGDYYLDEKNQQAYLSEEGHQNVEKLLQQAGLIKEDESLYDASNIILMHHLNAAIRAHALFHKDVDYIVKDGEVIIVDEHTGRTMPGRRWSEGLHQAVEAKEGVHIQNENQTLASITFQNYFRIYEKLSGMTGTADTEAYEFHQIYGLEVVVIPTHKPLIRKDMSDLVFMTAEEKFDMIIKDIESCRERKQPVLVGTVSIEVSEYLSRLLNQKNIPHQVLNAKFHEKEAQIIMNAGQPGAVTIATNMAGRGTDIVLGGNVEKQIQELENPSEEEVSNLRAEWEKAHDIVVEAGGLHMVGTERHESRRIDNQLRGRSGRQGDPGSSRFYLSLEDNLLRIFAADRIKGLMQRIGMEKGTALESGLLTRCIEGAQRKVEAHNFDIRKQLLEYDDVANDQRQVVYQQRHELMQSEDISENIKLLQQSVLERVIHEYMPPDALEDAWDVKGLEGRLANDFHLKLSIQVWLDKEESIDVDVVTHRALEASDKLVKEKEEKVGAEVMRQFEKAVMLQTLDQYWRDHLAAMDHLRQGIHLRGYAQKNPKQEYKREAFNLFSAMLEHIKEEVISVLSTFEVRAEEDIEAIEAQRRQAVDMHMQHSQMTTFGGEVEQEESDDKSAPFVRQQPKVGRNDPCPCGSGKKFKQCHGKIG